MKKWQRWPLQLLSLQCLAIPWCPLLWGWWINLNGKTLPKCLNKELTGYTPKKDVRNQEGMTLVLPDLVPHIGEKHTGLRRHSMECTLNPLPLKVYLILRLRLGQSQNVGNRQLFLLALLVGCVKVCLSHELLCHIPGILVCWLTRVLG